MDLFSIWHILEEEIFARLNEIGGVGFARLAQENGLQPGWMTWVAGVWLFPDEPITVDGIGRVFPYRPMRLIEQRLASAFQQGFLCVDGLNSYQPTDAGASVSRRLLMAGDASIAGLQPMPQARLQQLVEFLKRLSEASQSAPEPPSHFFITHYRNMYLGEDAPLLRRYIQYYKELDCYRVDAHQTAWQGYDIEGHAWEALTYIWRGQANSLDRLYAEVGAPEINRQEVANDLNELVQRGWIREQAGAFATTAEGDRIRQEAEELTNQLFFASWICLEEDELEDLSILVIQMRDGIRGK